MSEGDTYTVTGHLDGKSPQARAMYDQILAIVESFGPVQEQPTETSIHLVHASPMARIEVRDEYLILEFLADHRIDSPRVEEVEELSPRRFYHRVRITSLSELDSELKDWLRAAYSLSS